MPLRKRVIVDMDGIVADFFGALWQEYYRRTGEKVKTDQILTWNMGDHVRNGPVLAEIFREPGFFLRLRPLPGAIHALERLNKRYDVVYASYACTPHAAMEKMHWIEQWTPFIAPGNVILCHRKELIKGHALIDDGLHNAMAYRKAWPRALILSIAYPYNNGDAYDHRVEGHRAPAGAWKQMVEIVEAKI